jgi:hypothetical protein
VQMRAEKLTTSVHCHQALLRAGRLSLFAIEWCPATDYSWPGSSLDVFQSFSVASADMGTVYRVEPACRKWDIVRVCASSPMASKVQQPSMWILRSRWYKYTQPCIQDVV